MGAVKDSGRSPCINTAIATQGREITAIQNPNSFIFRRRMDQKVQRRKLRRELREGRGRRGRREQKAAQISLMMQRSKLKMPWRT